MIPPQSRCCCPIIEILTLVELDHTYPGLILSNVGGGYLLSFAVFVYVGFMRSVPSGDYRGGPASTAPAACGSGGRSSCRWCG